MGKSMGKRMGDRVGVFVESRPFGAVSVMGMALAVMSIGCAKNETTPLKRPSEPLITGEPQWPEDVTRQAERADRVCSQRQAQLLYDYEEAKQDQQKFKTIMGSITGGVGTVGGAVGGVGAYVIDSPETIKKVTGITGIVTAGLGAVGSVVTLVLSPGESKMHSASASIASIEQKRAAARTALTQKDPSTWSEEEKEAWSKAAKDLEAACK
ncbi:hypothetical protein [Polyangium sp. 15x6]|uniref:hypothetical protein n=1 Tax=Polyangium sp. 15x6 TaxID=3042687 RepID=UPI00249A5FA1|nr:hypothetical protein [Polyangium sp. 15x6]MDI3290074.1 hypothetical protein [Polyangium sp. 15x6]